MFGLSIIKTDRLKRLEEDAHEGRRIMNRATDLRWWMPDGSKWTDAARFILGNERIDVFRDRVTGGRQ